MSVYSMASLAAARTTKVAAQAVPPNVGYLQLARVPGKEPAPESTVTAALGVIVSYIPTEVITAYVAVVAALQDKSASSVVPPWAAFWAFLVASPIVVWLVYAAKVQGAGQPVPFSPMAWPRWEMSAATIAYAAWAFALPGTPFVSYSWYSTALAGVMVPIVAVVLGLLAPLFQQRPITA